MSIRVMSEVWDSATNLKDSQLLVLLAIADHCNEDRECWPSIPRLAEKARISERHTQRVIRALASAGYITIEDRGAEHKSNIYTVATADVLAELSVTDLPSGWKGDTGVTVTPVSPKGDACVTERVTPVSPQPSVNRQESSTRSAHNALIRAVMAHFTELTGLKPIGSETQIRWRAPAKEILELVDWDIGAANRLVLSAYQKMREQHLTYNSIQSIVRVAQFIHSQEVAPARTGMKQW